MNDPLDGNEFTVIHGDNVEVMATLPPRCVDHVVCSPPFPLLYAYTSEMSDIGNSEGTAEMKLHLSFFYKQLVRVVKPGRVVLIHVMQIPRLKRAGGQGLSDFRGLNIRLAERAGLVYSYDWLIRANPQSQAIRTKSRELQFAGLESDRARCRGALGSYLIKFMVPGDNDVAIDSPEQVTRNDWIDWAEDRWEIRETDTLNTRRAKSESDTRHICPLQLGTYERAIRLYTNPGEIVMDPFAGIGSCGFVALGGTSPVTKRAVLDERRFLGIELKPEWHAEAIRNCETAIVSRQARQRTLFDVLETS